MATYGQKQGWQCHVILNESERMSNSETKAMGLDMILTEPANTPLLIEQVGWPAWTGLDPVLLTEGNGVPAGGRCT